MAYKEFRRGFEIKKLDAVEKDIIPFNKEILKSEWEQGGQEGEPCHVPLYSLDPSNPYSTKKITHFSWKRGFQNVWTGWPNDGKTQYCLFMMLVKSLHDGWKWVVWSPEMRSAQFVNGKVIINANDIINLLVWMMSGVTPYKHVAEKYGTPRLSIDEYFQLVEVVKTHFIFLDPENKTPKALNELLTSLYEKDGFDGVLIDPWKNVRQDIDKRSDIWLEEVFSDTKDFAVKTNTSWNWIAHPKANVEKYRKGANGMTEIMPVTQEKLNGGAAWDNSMDGIYSIFRYNLHLNINSREVMFKNIKQRKQELVGERGDVDNIVFDAAKRRYIFSGIDPLQR